MAYRLPSNAAKKLGLCLAVLIVSVLSGCDESLPPRQNQEPLKVTFSTPSGLVIVKGGEVISARDFSVDFINQHDEALSDTEQIHVDIQIWLKDDPSLAGIATSEKSDLVDPLIVSGAYLTILPNTPGTIRTQWNYRDRDGRPFWGLADGDIKVGPTGVRYIDSFPMTFVAQATIQLFRRLPPWKMKPVEFSVSYRIFLD